MFSERVDICTIDEAFFLKHWQIRTRSDTEAHVCFYGPFQTTDEMMEFLENELCVPLDLVRTESAGSPDDIGAFFAGKKHSDNADASPGHLHSEYNVPLTLEVKRYISGTKLGRAGNLIEFVSLITGEFNSSSDAKMIVGIIGGNAVIAHGVERTTKDVDFLVASDFLVGSSDIGGDKEREMEMRRRYIAFLRKRLHSEGFSVKHIPYSNDPEETFHNELVVAVLKDESGIVDAQIDFLFPCHEWEREGMSHLKKIGRLPLSVMDSDFLVLMKLKADGPQDLVDAANLCLLMDAEKIRALLMYVESIAENMPRSFFTCVTKFLDKQLREKAPIVDSRIDSEEIPR